MSKKTSVKKLHKISRPESAKSGLPLIEWTAKNKGLSIQGTIQKETEFKNRFGNASCIIEMKVETVSGPTHCPARKDLSKLPVDVKFFRPAALRDLLSQVNTDYLVCITYKGKDDEGNHDFDLMAEKPIPF